MHAKAKEENSPLIIACRLCIDTKGKKKTRLITEAEARLLATEDDSIASNLQAQVVALRQEVGERESIANDYKQKIDEQDTILIKMIAEIEQLKAIAAERPQIEIYRDALSQTNIDRPPRQAAKRKKRSDEVDERTASSEEMNRAVSTDEDEVEDLTDEAEDETKASIPLSLESLAARFERERKKTNLMIANMSSFMRAMSHQQDDITRTMAMVANSIKGTNGAASTV